MKSSKKDKNAATVKENQNINSLDQHNRIVRYGSNNRGRF
ncbi:hypothetical protein J2Z43_000444 [Clostridioides mangenotii]|uniref:Uncharacterized protein n=1 Tax=Metaclostridioides mangenotii TaxID=1540 RepID=A0ABS4E7Y1_9FIRM|nr:hypothetical protein [Clostridioides mangenotii]